MKEEIAVFGGGCFWCTEAVFQRLRGISKVESGYAGGETPNPTYEQICTGKTGHAEVIRISFNSSIITYQQLLEVFFATHDPTSLNRQGADRGTQYRSVIFYLTEDQRLTAEKMIEAYNQDNTFGSKIVTELSPLKEFFPAESDHQNYYNDNLYQPYCQIVIDPKISKLQKGFSQILKN